MNRQNNRSDRISDTWLRGAYNVVDRIEYVGLAIWDRVFASSGRSSSTLEEAPQSEAPSRFSS